MTKPAIDAWIGREECARDTVTLTPVQGLAATLDLAAEFHTGSALPLLGHWLYFLPTVPTAGLGSDGHPRKGEFLPPIALPRRMWAGSQIEFQHPLHIGLAIERRSRITDIKQKEGRSGSLAFITLRHEVFAEDELAIIEHQDIVYRHHPPADATPAEGVRPPHGAQWRRRIEPTSTLLFRYSALTFNSHRIHYDAAYAKREEGYPALVVHGPLIATLMLDHLCRALPDLRVASFSFRAVKPLFVTDPFDVCIALEGDTAHLWAEDQAGYVATSGLARLT